MMNFPINWDAVTALLQMPILNGISLVLTLMFGAMSWVFYQRQKQIKDLWYYVEEYGGSLESIPPSAPYISDIGLEGTLDEDTPDYQRHYQVTIWNRGKSTIEGTAISSADPLVITAGENHQITKAHISSESRKATSGSVVVTEGGGAASVSFTFLDWRDGVEIDLLVKRRKEAPPQQLVSKFQIGPARITKKRKFSIIQVSGTVMGVSHFNQLRDLPASESITMIVIGGSVLSCIFTGFLFAWSQVFSLAWGLYFAAAFAAPAFLLFFWQCFFVAIYLALALPFPAEQIQLVST